MRAEWRIYPGVEPSVKFADQIDGSHSVTSAWPAIPGYRAGNDICKPFTAEGYVAHPEWRTRPTAWQSIGNPFLMVVETLQYDLNNQYGGRAT